MTAATATSVPTTVNWTWIWPPPGAQGGPGGATNPEHAGGPVALNPVRAADLRYVGPAAVVGQGELMS